MKTGGGMRVSGSGSVVHGFRFRVSDFGFRVAFRVRDFGFRASSGFWVSGKLQISVLGRFADFGFRAMCGFRVLGVGFQVSGGHPKPESCRFQVLGHPKHEKISILGFGWLGPRNWCSSRSTSPESGNAFIPSTTCSTLWSAL